MPGFQWERHMYCHWKLNSIHIRPPFHPSSSNSMLSCLVRLLLLVGANMEAVWVRINDIVIPDIIWSMAGFLEQGVPFRSYMVGVFYIFSMHPSENFNIDISSENSLNGLGVWGLPFLMKIIVIRDTPQGPFNIQIAYKYRQSHYKYKTISRPSHLYNGNS